MRVQVNLHQGKRFAKHINSLFNVQLRHVENVNRRTRFFDTEKKVTVTSIFRGSWGSSKKWHKPLIKPLKQVKLSKSLIQIAVFINVNQ